MISTARRPSKRREEVISGGSLITCRQTEPFKPTHELPILHHRHRTKSAESVVHRATDKDPRVSVVVPQHPNHGAEPGEPSAEPRARVEDKAEISTNDARISREHLTDPIQRS